MTDSHTVEVTLCTDCVFDVGNQCEHRWCNTWLTLARIKSRQVIRNMVETAREARLSSATCRETGCRAGHPPATVIANGRLVCDSCGNEAAQRMYARQMALRVGK